MSPFRIINLTFGVQMLIGVFLYYYLSSIEGVKLFKLFNVFGLYFDVVGVLFLSEMLAKPKEKYIYILDYVYAFFSHLMFCVWIGVVFIGKAVFFWMFLPSREVVSTFFGWFSIFAIVLLFVVHGVDTFRMKIGNTVGSRFVLLGWCFLLTGLILQMIGALMDLVDN